MQRFISGGSELYYELYGSGRPLVFLHGFLEDHSIWRNCLEPLLDEDFQCLVLDLPCHGMSRFHSDSCDLSDVANMVSKLLHHLKIENPWIVGHSMGGYIGLEMLRNQAAGLTLVHSNFWADSDQKKLDRNRVIDIVQKNLSLFLNEAIPNLFAPDNREQCMPDIIRLIRTASLIPPREIAAATAGLRDRRASYDVMESHRVWMIHGSGDPIIPHEVLRNELEKLSNKPPILTLDGVGHMGFIEDPQALLFALRQTLFQ